MAKANSIKVTIYRKSHVDGETYNNYYFMGSYLIEDLLKQLSEKGSGNSLQKIVIEPLQPEPLTLD